MPRTEWRLVGCVNSNFVALRGTTAQIVGVGAPMLQHRDEGATQSGAVRPYRVAYVGRCLTVSVAEMGAPVWLGRAIVLDGWEIVGDAIGVQLARIKCVEGEATSFLGPDIGEVVMRPCWVFLELHRENCIVQSGSQLRIVYRYVLYKQVSV